jgi:hypothetical protein
MYSEVPNSLPRDFFYNLTKLKGSMSKNLIKVTADRVNASPGNITNFRLPIGSLLQLNSLSLWWKTTLTGTNPTIPARYASSFIKRMSISCNNVVITQIEDYNLLYNLMADHKNKAQSKGIGGEFLDNSVIWGEGAITGTTQSALTATNALLASTTNQANMQMCVNNFLGFLGSTSTPIIPSDRFGEIVVSIQWVQPYEVLGGTAESSATTYSDNSFSIDDLYLTCEALSFSADDYYTSIGNKDLMFGFDDYIITKFAETTKTAGISATTYISANSIDWVAGTAIRAQTAPKPMVGWGSLGAGDGSVDKVVNVYQYLADPVAYVNNVDTTTHGDGFMNTEYLVRDLQGISSAQFSINNKALNYAALNKHEIFQNNLCCLGYEGTDASRNGLIDTCVSIYHYFKYYAMVMQSLQLVDKDQFNISGLSSAGSSCSINWQAKFDGNATYPITPVIIAKLSKVLHVKSGRNISIE